MIEKAGNSYHHILKYTSIFGSVQGLNIVAGLVRNKIIAILLGPSGMGLISLLNTWQGFVCQVTNLGISFGAVPRLSELYDEGNDAKLLHRIMVIRTWSVLTAIIGFVFCIIASPFISQMIDSNPNHIFYLVLIAPSVAILAITGGETAVLKATRRLGALAKVQMVAAIASVLVSLPFYYILGIGGIVPVMIVMAFITMVVTIFYSYRQYPFRISLSRQVLTDGRSMIQLGVAFVVAAIIGSLAELLIRLFLNYHNQMGEVGLYNAAYTLTISYAALVLASLETDYFPRLSASAHDLQTAQMIVNRQMEVLFLLLAPMLTALMVFLPWLVPLLYTEQFLSIVPMAQIMVIAMYFKALSVPVCFMPLAFQESRFYLLLEISYWLYFLMFFFICYELWGLRGVGIAWVIAHVVEWLVAWAWVHHHYHYQLSLPMIRHIVIQLIIAMTTWLVTMYLSDSSYWISGCLLTMMSGGFSCWILSCKR